MSDGVRVKRIEPRLLRRQQAARYLDMSGSAFDGLVKQGVLPQPKRLHSFRVWDRDDLDSLADALPYDGAAKPDETWDD